MQSAPAVTVRLHRFGAWNAGVLGSAAGACVLLALLLKPLVWAWMAGGVLAAGFAAWAAWRRQPCSLVWDGQAWHLDQRVDALTAEVAADLPWVLLLRLRPESVPRLAFWRVVWLPVVAQPGLDLHALRCALYGRARLPLAGAAGQPLSL